MQRRAVTNHTKKRRTLTANHSQKGFTAGRPGTAGHVPIAKKENSVTESEEIRDDTTRPYTGGSAVHRMSINDFREFVSYVKK